MDISRVLEWRPSAETAAITAIDAHTAGEPLRVILAGFPALEGGSMLEKRQFSQKRVDRIRTALG